MPELPDIECYAHALRVRVQDQVLRAAVLSNVFVLRTAEPPWSALIDRRVRDLRRVGKRVVLGFDEDLFLVVHLMIAGRLHWRDGATKPAGRGVLAHWVFDGGVLSLTEAGTKRRASLHVVRGEAALSALDPGGSEPLQIELARFAQVLRGDNRTLKRALTDPRTFSGIGNAYSDEILHAAGLSPLALTGKLDDAQIARLHRAMQDTLRTWKARLRDEAGERFPDKVTAFRPDMAVHGRYGLPCPVCGTTVQRIVHASNEINYCPRCQTEGRILADRAFSRLLHDSFPRHLDDL
jgi:formamidopyrimidine-DNA glycosylase